MTVRQIRRFLAKIASFPRRGAIERDLDREVSAHLTLLADDFERRGMSPSEARDAALRTFGSVDVAIENSRDERALVWLEQAWQDLRHACRTLRRNPGFTLLAVVTIACGTGTNAALFTIYNAVALKPLPVSNPREVVRLERWFEDGSLGDIQYAFSYPEYAHCRDHAGALTGLVAASWPVRVVADVRGLEAGAGSPEPMQGELVSINYFTALGISASIGRTISPADDAVESAVMVLSNRFWRSRFGADPAVLGRVVAMNGAPFTIVGVAPESFTGTSVALQVPDFWVPLSAQPQLVPGTRWQDETTIRPLQVLARLRPATPLGQAEAEVNALLRQLDTTTGALDRTTAVTLQRTAFLGNTEDPRFEAAVAGLMLLVGVVLLAACANLANMLFARGVARQRELAIRLALGASRRRVVRHLFTESLLLALLGGAVGLACSTWAIRLCWLLLQQSFAGSLVRAQVIALDFSPDLTVYAYTASISIAAAVLFGLSPALRSCGAGLSTAVRDGGFGLGAHVGRSRIRAALMAGQVAASAALLVIAGLLARGVVRSFTTETGLETRRVFLVLADAGGTPIDAAASQRRLAERLRTLPEVSRVAIGSAPLMGTWTPPMVVDGPQNSIRGRTLASYASEGYFETLGIPLVRGRSLTREDVDRGTRVAVISESTARRFWPGHDPLGQRFQLDQQFRGDLTTFEVVGIARDVRFANLTRIDPAHVYLPAPQSAPAAILVRAGGDLLASETAARRAIAGYDRALAARATLVTIEEGPVHVRQAVTRLLAILGASLAAVATLLAAVGIYGVMAFLVNQRVREIGVRIALGARSDDVLKAIVLRGLRPVTVGLACGLAAAGGAASILQATLAAPESNDLMYGVPFYDPATFLGVSCLVLVVAAVATVIPARRALSVEPIVALRHD